MNGTMTHTQKSTIGRAPVYATVLRSLSTLTPNLAAMAAAQLFVTPMRAKPPQSNSSPRDSVASNPHHRPNHDPNTRPDAAKEAFTMSRLSKNHPSIPKLHRWLRRWFEFRIDLTGLDIHRRDIELDLSAGRD